MRCVAVALGLSDKERAAVQDLQRIRPVWNLIIPAHFLALAVAVWGAVRWPFLPVQIAAAVFMGFSMHALAMLQHDALHMSLFRSRELDRLVGLVLGIPVLLSPTAYWHIHMPHHRYTRTDRDPDDPLLHEVRPWRHTVGFVLWMLFGSLVYVVTIPMRVWKRAPVRDRVRIALECSFIATVFATAIALCARGGRLDLFLQFWVMPFLIAVWISNVRGWAEHQMTRPGSPFTNTRTVAANPVVSFLMCNIGYHTEHHLFPAVPWYNLPRLHRLLQHRLRDAGALVYTSYLAYLRDAIMAGGRGELP